RRECQSSVSDYAQGIPSRGSWDTNLSNSADDCELIHIRPQALDNIVQPPRRQFDLQAQLIEFVMVDDETVFWVKFDESSRNLFALLLGIPLPQQPDSVLCRGWTCWVLTASCSRDSSRRRSPGRRKRRSSSGSWNQPLKFSTLPLNCGSPAGMNT